MGSAEHGEIAADYASQSNALRACGFTQSPAGLVGRPLLLRQLETTTLLNQHFQGVQRPILKTVACSSLSASVVTERWPASRCNTVLASDEDFLQVGVGGSFVRHKLVCSNFHQAQGKCRDGMLLCSSDKLSVMV